jgi:hypothetical protein
MYILYIYYKMAKNKYNPWAASIVDGIPDTSEFWWEKTDFIDFKLLIINLEAKLRLGEKATDYDTDSVVNWIMDLRDSKWHISNKIIQEMFSIDYRDPVDESKLRDSWVPKFIAKLPGFVTWEIHDLQNFTRDWMDNFLRA